MNDTTIEVLEVLELREAVVDGGDLMGYYCRGHVDRHLFAEAANRMSGATRYYDIRWVDPLRCRHVWYRTVQMEGEPRGTMEFRPVLPPLPGDKPPPGIWAATVCDCVADAELRRSRRVLDDFQRGRCQGISAGVGWCLHLVEAHDRELAARLLEAFREQRDKLENTLC